MAPPATPPTWANTWRFVVGIVVCLVIGWYAFARGTAVPILSGVDLAFHEASHFLTSFLPDVIYFAGGSIGQILWPLGIGIAFLVVNKDPLGAGLCFAWSGSAAQNVSLYIADAPTMALPLIGGLHDWNTILGDMDHLEWSEPLSRLVWTGGLLVWISGIGLCIAGPWVVRRREAREAIARAEPPAGPRDGRSGGPPATGWAIVPPWEGPAPEASPPEPPVAPLP